MQSAHIYRIMTVPVFSESEIVEYAHKMSRKTFGENNFRLWEILSSHRYNFNTRRSSLNRARCD